MNADDEIAKLEGEKRAYVNWMSNPVTQMLLKDNASEQAKLVEIILRGEFEDLKQYSIAIGHLRGLKRAFGVIEDEIEVLDRQIQDLK